MTSDESHRLILVGGPRDGNQGSLLAATVGRHLPPYICTRSVDAQWHHYRASGDPTRYLYMGPCATVEHPNGAPHDHE